MKISFIYKRKTEPFQSDIKRIKKELKLLINRTAAAEKTDIRSVNLIFCDDSFIADYNKEYLGHDYSTDIITFYDKDNGGIEGELLISADTVLDNSKRFRTDFDNELKRVVIHGILHLCGYDDRTTTQKAIIRKKENFYLKH